MLQQQQSPPFYPRLIGNNQSNLDGLTFSNDTLLVWIESQGSIYHMVLGDLIQVFSRYGTIQSVQMLKEGNAALIHYMKHNSANLAIEKLDGRALKGISGTLRVQLLSNSIDDDFSDYSEESQAKTKIVKKYTVRYDVQIDPDDGFDVAKRIIGIKGINMKQIHNKTKSKLRLRGKGSGYLEGHNRKEAPELLHLCISCQDHSNYSQARNMVEDLLNKIYREYDSWRVENGLDAISLRPKYHETLIQFPVPCKNQKGEAREFDCDTYQRDLIDTQKNSDHIDNFIDLLKSKFQDPSSKFHNDVAQAHMTETSDRIFSSAPEDYFTRDNYPILSSGSIQDSNAPSPLSSPDLRLKYDFLKSMNSTDNSNMRGNFKDCSSMDQLENYNSNASKNVFNEVILQNLKYLASIMQPNEGQHIDPMKINSEVLNQFFEKLPENTNILSNLGQFDESPNNPTDSLSNNMKLRPCNESFYGLSNIKPMSHFNEILSTNQFALHY